MIKIEIFQTVLFGFAVLNFLSFKSCLGSFVSDFVLRISDLPQAVELIFTPGEYLRQGR